MVNVREQPIFEKASTESTHIMREAGFSERVVRLANSVGHEALLEERLTAFIREKSGQSVSSKDLPQFIDEAIQQSFEHV